MSKLNRQPRKFNTIFRRCVIVRPEIKTGSHRSGTAWDYIDVPMISTRGEWPILHMLTDDNMGRLAIGLREMGLL